MGFGGSGFWRGLPFQVLLQGSPLRAHDQDYSVSGSIISPPTYRIYHLLCLREALVYPGVLSTGKVWKMKWDLGICRSCSYQYYGPRFLVELWHGLLQIDFYSYLLSFRPQQ